MDKKKIIIRQPDSAFEKPKAPIKKEENLPVQPKVNSPLQKTEKQDAPKIETPKIKTGISLNLSKKSTFSISKEKPETEEKIDKKPILEKQLNPFNQEDLVREWKRYTETLGDRLSVKTMFENYSPKLNDGFKIEFQINTEVHNNLLKKGEQAEITTFLRKNLKNDDVELDIIKTEKEILPVVHKSKTEKLKTLINEREDLKAFVADFELDLT